MRLLAVLSFALLSSLPLATVNGGGAPSLPVRAWTEGYGVQLSLAMPHGPYTWNSFLPVTTRLLNVSGRTVKVGFTEESFSCFVKGPVVEVRQRSGAIVFPPSILDATPLPCPRPPSGFSVPLRPGAEIVWNGYVILRAAHVLARVTLVQGKQDTVLSTRPVTINLCDMPPPGVALHTDGAVFADLARPAGARGPMLAADWWECNTVDAASAPAYATSRPSAVRMVRGTNLTPSIDQRTCSRLLQWHAVAGWAGFPTARVDYTAPGGQGRRLPAVGGRTGHPLPEVQAK